MSVCPFFFRKAAVVKDAKMNSKLIQKQKKRILLNDESQRYQNSEEIHHLAGFCRCWGLFVLWGRRSLPSKAAMWHIWPCLEEKNEVCLPNVLAGVTLLPGGVGSNKGQVQCLRRLLLALQNKMAPAPPRNLGKLNTAWGTSNKAVCPHSQALSLCITKGDFRGERELRLIWGKGQQQWLRSMVTISKTPHDLLSSFFAVVSQRAVWKSKVHLTPPFPPPHPAYNFLSEVSQSWVSRGSFMWLTSTHCVRDKWCYHHHCSAVSLVWSYSTMTKVITILGFAR